MHSKKRYTYYSSGAVCNCLTRFMTRIMKWTEQMYIYAQKSPIKKPYMHSKKPYKSVINRVRQLHRFPMICVCVHVSEREGMYISINICTCMYIYICICICIYTCMYISIYICTCMYIYMYMYMYIYMYVYIYTHICTHSCIYLHLFSQFRIV